MCRTVFSAPAYSCERHPESPACPRGTDVWRGRRASSGMRALLPRSRDVGPLLSATQRAPGLLAPLPGLSPRLSPLPSPDSWVFTPGALPTAEASEHSSPACPPGTAPAPRSSFIRYWPGEEMKPVQEKRSGAPAKFQRPRCGVCPPSRRCPQPAWPLRGTGSVPGLSTTLQGGTAPIAQMGKVRPSRVWSLAADG